MARPGESPVAREVSGTLAAAVVFGSIVLGIAALLATDVVGWPWYLRAIVGLLLGSVLGGVSLGVVAGVQARLRERTGN